MLVCRIELWPFGQAEHSRLLGSVLIANDGTGTPQWRNYHCALTRSGCYSSRRGIWRSGRVVHHRRGLSPYHLLLKALEESLAAGPHVQPAWAKRMDTVAGAYQPPRQYAADEMRKWLQSPEANLPIEQLVEPSPFPPPGPPDVAKQLYEAAGALLDVVDRGEPTHWTDAREYWRDVGRGVRRLQWAHQQYSESKNEEKGSQ